MGLNIPPRQGRSSTEQFLFEKCSFPQQNEWTSKRCCFCTQYWDPSPILINATLCWMSVFFDFPSFNSPSINDALELDTLTKHNNCLATCTPQLTTIIQQLYTFDGILPDHLYRSTSYYLLIKWVDCMKLHCYICFSFMQRFFLVIFFFNLNWILPRFQPNPQMGILWPH